ncbi:MAG: NAD+ synthase [Acidimicrobiia bacterium]
MRALLAQLDFVVGDVEGNSRRISDVIAEARKSGIDLVAFPELALTGYPPEDLLLKPSFVEANLIALRDIAARCEGIVAVVGHVGRLPAGLTNAASVLRDGKVVSTYAKRLLPNYGVFDEKRYFVPGDDLVVVTVGNPSIDVGISICEDAWSASGPFIEYRSMGVGAVLNINGSPYHMRKSKERSGVVAERATEANAAVMYLNLVGGQDELVFDGGSFVVDAAGVVRARAAQFEEALFEIEVDPQGTVSGPIEPEYDPLGEVYAALLLGTKDYVEKNGFSGVVVGLSGGIDSSLTATIAADALGPDGVVGVSMPSRFTSDQSRRDAADLASRLGIRFIELSIEKPFRAYLEVLEPVFEGRSYDITEENIQARIRGNYLMALSNKFGWLVLATGNKSELATGYSTLYGDMVGGFSVLKDVPKTLVYSLARYRNFFGVGDLPPRQERIDAMEGLEEADLQMAVSKDEGPIPHSVLYKPPTAELREGQTDQDTLPPYEVLDRIIEIYVEEDGSLQDVVDSGIDEETARRVTAMIDAAEYKRRQAAPGVKITAKAFGKDRRLPITNRYRG